MAESNTRLVDKVCLAVSTLNPPSGVGSSERNRNRIEIKMEIVDSDLNVDHMVRTDDIKDHSRLRAGNPMGPGTWTCLGPGFPGFPFLLVLQVRACSSALNAQDGRQTIGQFSDLDGKAQSIKDTQIKDQRSIDSFAQSCRRFACQTCSMFSMSFSPSNNQVKMPNWAQPVAGPINN